MSTIPEALQSDTPASKASSHKALAILTATAVGGVLGSRLPKTPLMLAAGAAALAWLNQKRPTSPRAAVILEPEPAQKQEPIPNQDQIQQWISQQFTREAKASFLEPQIEPIDSESAYMPQSLLAEDATIQNSWPHEVFASLTEPVGNLLLPPPAVENPSPPVLHTPDSSWVLGVEPLPTWNESSPLPVFNSQRYSSQSVLMENLPPPILSQPVFEGSALPDQIEVAPPLETVAHLTPTFPQGLETADEKSTAITEPAPILKSAPPTEVREISVQFATPGEASFDTALAAAPINPWTPLETPPEPVMPAPPDQHIRPLVEAEIILRPRAPIQVSAAPKQPHVSLRFIKKSVEAPITSNAFTGEDKNLLNAPAQSPPDEIARKTWISWWRED